MKLTIPIVWSHYKKNQINDGYLGLELRPGEINSTQDKLYKTIAELVRERCHSKMMDTIEMTSKSGYILNHHGFHRYGGYLEIQDKNKLTKTNLGEIKEIAEETIDSLDKVEPHLFKLSIKDASKPGRTKVLSGTVPLKKAYSIMNIFEYGLVLKIRKLASKEEFNFDYLDMANVERTILVPPQSSSPMIESTSEESAIKIIGINCKDQRANIELISTSDLKLCLLNYKDKHLPKLYKNLNPEASNTYLEVTIILESYFVNGDRLAKSCQLVSINGYKINETLDLIEKLEAN